MCTITYIPGDNGSFKVCNNRDESPQRIHARPPEFFNINGIKVLAPVDGKAGGTWFAVSEYKRLISIMNGAFAPHRRDPPYRKSRGLIALDCVAYDSAPVMASEISLEGIEPFTAILIDAGEEHRVFELRWDGTSKHFNEVRADHPHIWSSENLYSPFVRAKREKWFDQFLEENTEVTPEKLLNFHLVGGESASSDEKIHMNRNNKVQTVSTILAEYHCPTWSTTYIDHLHQGAVDKKILKCR